MDGKFVVIIGDDEFYIPEAKRNQEAKYKACRLFRSKYHLNYSLNKIAYFAVATQIPNPEFTTNRILAILGKMEEVPA